MITAPAYDADGQLTGFQSGSPDGTGVFSWTPDSGAHGGHGLAYSPDGSRVAFYSDSYLWVARADGTQAHRIAVSGLQGAPYGSDGRPAWSPDGTTVYFEDTSRYDTPGCPAVIDRVQADGARVEPIATIPLNSAAAGCLGVSAVLSASVNGDVSISLGDYYGTRIWHHGDGSLTDYSFPDLLATEADFSPDGKSLVFIGIGQGNGMAKLDGVYVGGVATSALDEIFPIADNPDLPKDTGNVRTPVWSPDGSEVAFLEEAYDGGPAPANRVEVFHFADRTTTVAEGFHAAAPLVWRPRTAPLPPPAVPTVDRIGGADRIATAVDASRFEFVSATSTTPGARKAACAVLTRSDSYADALSGSALAGAKECPLLLTPTAAAPEAVLDELRRVLPQGATVYVLGGTDVLSPTVESQVAAAGFTPHRLAGDDRYATSLAIAQEISPHPGLVLVATGEDFPDALAAGAVASSRAGGVVLIQPPGQSTPGARAYLTSAMAGSPTAQIAAVGGQGFASLDTVFSRSQVNGWFTDGRFFDAAGADRYYTAHRLFQEFGNVSHRTVAVATGMNWADALAGGSVAGLNNGLLLLTNGYTFAADQTQDLGVANGAVTEMLVFGGPDVVSPQAVSAVESATGETTWNYSENRQAPTLP